MLKSNLDLVGGSICLVVYCCSKFQKICFCCVTSVKCLTLLFATCVAFVTLVAYVTLVTCVSL